MANNCLLQRLAANSRFVANNRLLQRMAANLRFVANNHLLQRMAANLRFVANNRLLQRMAANLRFEQSVPELQSPVPFSERKNMAELETLTAKLSFKHTPTQQHPSQVVKPIEHVKVTDEVAKLKYSVSPGSRFNNKRYRFCG